MKIEIEKLPKSEIKLTIEVSAKKLESFKSKTVAELQNQVEISGFRKGHTPEDVLIKHVGEGAFKSHMLEIALEETYQEAIKEHKLSPISYPKINIVSQDPFKYEAVFTSVPEIEIKKGYEKVAVKPKEIKVEKKEMEEVLNNLQKRSTKWNFVEREAKKGDRVEIDFDGTDMDGLALEGTSSKNHPVILGEGYFIPGFEDEVVGMKKGEEKDFAVTFPKDYHSEKFKSKKVKFHVKLNSIEEAEERKLDDAFAEELTGGKHKTLKDLEKEVEEELKHQKEHDAEVQSENEVIEKLAEYFKAEIPETLIERETDFLIDRLKGDVEKSGMKWEDYQKAKEDKKEDIKKTLRPQAEKQVLIRLGIEKLYEMEKISVSEGDINEELKHIFAHYPAEYQSKVAEYYKVGAPGYNQMENQLMLKKLVKKFIK